MLENIGAHKRNAFRRIMASICFQMRCHSAGLWYGEPNAIGYAKFYSRSHDAVIRVYDDAGNVLETYVREEAQRLRKLGIKRGL